MGRVTDRLLVDLSDDGRVSVGTWLENQLPQPGEFRDLGWPLDKDALEDLRWYLEDYLRAPFGVYEQRGAQVEDHLAGWGQAVFSAVFGDGPARDAYMQLRQRPVELIFRSDSTALLGLPWELMTDPAHPAAPLALRLAGLSRSLPLTDPAATVPVPAGRLRVLMVISRPAGDRDVGYRMIARPLLDRLEAVRGDVDLVVLRPPTLDALAEMLAAAIAAGEPFQVVHFDGHGALAGRRAVGVGPPLSFAEPAGEGILYFETPDGDADHVPSSRVAQVLAAAKVPVVVLNACQSGAVGKDLEAAVATRVLKAGVASVVGMAYSVYAVAAAEFMAVFYERLFAGETVTAAVTAGRQRLYQRNERPSPKGEMPLSDWLVPVHYLRRDVSFPQAHISRPRELPSLEEFLDEARNPSNAVGAGDLDAVGMFVGRDDLFYQLEVAARLQKVVLLHGAGGTGKTELAKAFGRWWRDTGGVEEPSWVFWHSFEPGVASFGLGGVITEIGLRVFGADFARLEPAERRDAVLRVLTERRALLIWDNFETVRSMPDLTGATKPLDGAGGTELKDFLRVLAEHGQSSVLITSRAPEDWLGGMRRITVGGLARHEAVEYAGHLLAPYPSAKPRRGRRVFGELMEWLDGHPLSMRVILPRLDTTDPEMLLAGLRGTAPLPDDQGAEDGRTRSLAASITYSFAHLTEATRRILPAISLFHGVAVADILGIFSAVQDVPVRFQDASTPVWLEALDEAARVGLLTSLSGGMYRIHPALPGYLATAWRGEEPDDHDAVRDAAIRALVAAHSDFGSWLRQQIESADAGLALAVIDLQRRTMGSLLGYALDHDVPEDAQAIAEPLSEYWRARGLDEEADAWADRARLALEGPDGTSPPLDTPAGSLWLFFTSGQANRQLARHHLDEAERTYRQHLAAIQALPPSRQQRHRLAVNYHHLGAVAQDRGQLDEAENWYRESLAISEELGDKPQVAMIYERLGIVAQRLGWLVRAEEWYRESLAIAGEVGDRLGVASAYHQLGIVAQMQGRLDEARDWHRQSLAIEEDLGDRPGMAMAYHELAMVAHDQGRLDEAEERCRESLAISEQLGNRPVMASTYHQLGRIAQDRGRLDEAEGWCRESLAIFEELGDKRGIALAFGQRGLLAGNRGQAWQALEWMVRCVTQFGEFPHPATASAPWHLVRLTMQLGMDALDESWQRVTGSPLPSEVRSYVESWSGQ